jgi:polyisoprenoid-binding protein YceI
MRFCLAIFLLAGLTTIASAQTASTWTGSAILSFKGTSTLHDWDGTVAASPFAVTVAEDGSGAPQRVRATVTVPSAKMDTADAKRDENMRKAMKSAEFPLITGDIDAAFSEIAGGDGAPARLPMALTLLGKTRPVTARVSNWKRQGAKASFDLDFEVSMASYGISVPAVLYFIRVGDRVTLHAKVSLTQS